MDNTHPTRKQSQKGSAVIEFALSSLLILGVLVVAFRFGYSFYVYNKLEGTVAAGARFASRFTYDSSTATPSQSYTRAVANMVVYGDPSGGSQPLVPGLSTTNVQVTVGMEDGVPKQARVAIVNFGLLGFDGWQLNGKPFAQFRYMGRFAP
jgi:Flp pilus assembly protein TadG